MFRPSVLRRGARLFATAAQGAREPAARTLAVSKAQGISNGLTEGTHSFPLLPLAPSYILPDPPPGPLKHH